jgi:hypothetical protein
MLAANRVRLMVNALTTQLSSMRPLEHEPVKECQDEDEHGRFGKE